MKRFEGQGGYNEDLAPSAPPAFPQATAFAQTPASYQNVPGSSYATPEFNPQYPLTLPISSAAEYPASMSAMHPAVTWGPDPQNPYIPQRVPGQTSNLSSGRPPSGGHMYAPSSGDLGVPLLYNSGGFALHDMMYANRKVRHAFLQKVLGLVTVQILLTALIAVLVVYSARVRRYLALNPWVLALSVILSTTILIILACSENIRRRHPINMFLLFVFTATEGLLVGTASATYNTDVLILALVITAAVTVALTVFASQTQLDFTASGGMLYSALVIFMVVMLANFFLELNTLDLLIAGCGALLFSAYLVYGVQLIASGEHYCQVSVDEYVFAAINIYTDIINLFLYILQTLQQLQGSNDD
eukprot:jgi/Chrzof1/3343/Cz12g21170.t1